MLLQEEANSIVTDTILDSSVGAAAKTVEESLRDGQKTELTEGSDRFYPYPNGLNLEKLTIEVLAPLKTFLDIIYPKSRTETAEKKKELQRIAVAHALMQFCKNEGYLSPLLWRLDCFFSKCRDHDFLWMYCTRLGSQFHIRRYSSSINVLLYPVKVQ